VNLVRDVLDKLVIDRNGREMGRVDGVVLDAQHGRPLRVAAIEIGPSVLAHRVHPVCGRLVEAAEHAVGIPDRPPCHIPFSDISEFGITLRVNVAIGATSAAAGEDWAREKLPAWLGG
jgi:sporulation protein YlmC with PRC-barrel domain